MLNHNKFISVCASRDFHACGLGNEPGELQLLIMKFAESVVKNNVSVHRLSKSCSLGSAARETNFDPETDRKLR